MLSRASTFVALALLFANESAAEAAQTQFEIAVEKIFRDAIVKIDVSAPNAVYKKNDQGESVNICKSEGTGFVVGSSHVLTAEHVYQLAEECGSPNIIVKAKKFSLQKIATVVAAKDDVALLKVDAKFPKDICALGVRAQDVYGVEAIRFGIPGGWEQPGPPAGVKVDQANGQFAPLTLMSPVIVEQGESGGPVIYVFNVIGMTRARHMQYKGFSFMTSAAAIRSVMAGIPAPSSEEICNPVKIDMATSILASGGESFPGFATSPIRGNVFGSVKLDNQLAEQSPVAKMFKDIKFKDIKADTNNKLVAAFGEKEVLFRGAFDSSSQYSEILYETTRTAGEVSQAIAEKLWKQYVADGKKSGLWKQPSPIPPGSR